MPEYNISDHFYTEKGSHISDANSVLKNSTQSLKKLATPYVNETKNNFFFQNQEVVSDKQATQFARNSIFTDGQGLKSLNGSTNGIGHLKKNVSILDDNLFLGSTSKPSSDDVQYCKYLSGTGPILSSDFIPTALPQKARNPIIAYEKQYDVNGGATYDQWEDLNDDDNDPDYNPMQNNPTGEWTSPVVKEALSRQVSKEMQFKTLWKNVAWLFGAHFFLLLAERIIQLHQLNVYDPNETLRDNVVLQFLSPNTSRYVEIIFKRILVYGRRLLWLLVVIIFINAAKFAWPQDQCKDLPLTLKQRELIGLRPLTDDIEDSKDNADLLLSKRLFEGKSSQCLQVPKYPRVNKLSEYIRKKENGVSDEDFAIALQSINPRRKLTHS